jgi:prepilin-type N-terminal cleavage/methylation domain-containing protein/prepilin-type processing-associated H-X9-DG protein
MRTPQVSPCRPAGFTLTETLVVIAVIAALALVAFQLGSRIVEKANLVVDISKMRYINSSIIARAQENNGLAYSKNEVGNSSYRAWDDPLSLCQVLDEYLPGEDAWLSPVTSKFQQQNKNSYAWSRAPNVTEKRISAVDNPHNTVTLWTSYCYTLPSVYNVPDGGASGGPRTAPKQYWSKPWNRGTAVNWFYLDGHVETR